MLDEQFASLQAIQVFLLKQLTLAVVAPLAHA